tara:strand:- start:10 stop:510 length:501 start_codon:yes stop_codon:yes gene_type:complete
MGYRKGIMPGFSKYKESPLKKEKKFEGSKRDTGGIKKNLKDGNFKVKFDAKMKAYDDLPLWKKVFTSPPNVVGGYAPGVGKLSKGGKKIIDAFTKSAPSRRKMIKQIEESLKKKGWKIHPSKTTHGKGKSPMKSLGSKGEYTKDSQRQGLEKSAKDARKIKRQRGY